MLLRIDRQPLPNDLAKVVMMLKGDAGTQAKLTLNRQYLAPAGQFEVWLMLLSFLYPFTLVPLYPLCTSTLLLFHRESTLPSLHPSTHDCFLKPLSLAPQHSLPVYIFPSFSPCMSFFLAGDPDPCSSCDIGPHTCQSCFKGQGHYRLPPVRGWALLVHAAGFLCVTDTEVS